MLSSVDRAEKILQKGGCVHLVGVAGIGMAGIAFLLKERNFSVSGCDVQENRQTDWLRKVGVHVFTGHDEGHITEHIDWLIRSTAVPDTHPEVCRAKALGIPISRRGEVLPALMRNRTCIAVAGTHGKTTTTAMIAQVLDCGYCIGGEVSGVEGVAKDAPLMVVEADESDGTVAGYTPDYAIITNIEYDHMEHHASEADFVECFEHLIRNTQEKVFFCAEDSIASRLGLGNQKCEPFTLLNPPLQLPIPGRHNQWNAAAAMAVCKGWKSTAEISHALANLRPIRRRFERVFEGGGIQIISDYAHHPTEVAALVQTALELKPKRLLGIFQPHRYTRTRALGADFPSSFEGLEKLWLVPVYAASEPPIRGGTTQDLMAHFPPNSDLRLSLCDGLEAAWVEVQSELKAGDIVLIIGAGDIEKIADQAKRRLGNTS